MLLAALTGGIGSGKSEVAKRFAALGADVVDADKIAREVVEPGTPGLQQVIDAFGDAVLTADGTLDREALGARVFADDEARKQLNSILHPLIGMRAMELIQAAAERSPDALVIQDIPLLAENAKLASGYETVIVVDVPSELQLARLVEQRGMAESDARARMAAQATREQRLAMATHVIDNTGTLDDLDAQVNSLFTALVARAAASSSAS